MAISDINIGSSPNDGTGSTLRAGGAIINQILDMWNFITGTSGNIHFVNGNIVVGDGTTTPRSEIKGAASSTSIASTSGAATGIFQYNEDTTNGNFNIYDHYNSNGLVDSRIVGIHVNHSTRVGEIAVMTHDGSSLAERARVNEHGLLVSGMPVYANNAAALSGGLSAGQYYKTASTGNATVMVVNAT